MKNKAVIVGGVVVGALVLVVAAGVESNRAIARTRLEALVASGAALERFGLLIEAQGGDRRVIDEPSRLPVAPVVQEIAAEADGVIGTVEPRAIGHVVVALGGGRSRTDEVIDPAVGVRVLVKPPMAFVIQAT